MKICILLGQNAYRVLIIARDEMKVVIVKFLRMKL